MSIRIKQLIHKLRKSETGAFTLENSIVFPIIFLMCLFMLFCGIYIYQKVVLFQQSSIAAMQAAHHWPAGLDGYAATTFEKNEQGLYWRLFDDSISQLLGFERSIEQAKLQLPVQKNGESLSLPQRKLLTGAAAIGADFSGEMQFHHYGVKRSITAALHAPFQSIRYAYFTLPDKISSEASATVSEPVEFLRTMELASGYLQQLFERINDKSKAGQAFEHFMTLKAPDSFRYHDDTVEHGEGAESYLRTLVNGQTDQRTLANGQIRKIDALDRHGIAHQAYVTFSTSRLRTVQMVKDLELLHNGEVSGVVWHFFRRSTNEGGRVGPPESFIQELEGNGIVVVIHD